MEKSIVFVICVGLAIMLELWIIQALSGGHGKPPVIYDKGDKSPIQGMRVL